MAHCQSTMSTMPKRRTIMRKNVLFFAAVTATATFVCLSCTKEQDNTINNIISQEENVASSQPVATINVGIGTDTKISHEYDDVNRKLKLTWGTGDKLVISFNIASTDYTEIWTVKSESVGQKSGEFEFTSGNSGAYTDATKLVDDTTINVAYEGNATSWATQDQYGTTGNNLPEILTGSGTYATAGTNIALSAEELTYFHFVFDEAATSNAGTTKTYANAYLYSNNPSIKLYNTPTVEGPIKINGAFTFDATGKPTSDIDIFVAAKISGTTKDIDNGLGIVFMDGDYYPGMESYGLTWTPKADYTAGSVYKKDAALSFNTGIVGLTNGETPAWAHYSTAIEIEKGKRLTLSLGSIMNTPVKELYKDAPLLRLENNSNRDYRYNIRMDRAGWGDGGCPFDRKDIFLDINSVLDLAHEWWNDDNLSGKLFQEIMSDANGTITIDYSQNGYVYGIMTYEHSGKVMTETFSYKNSDDSVWAILMPEGCYIIMKSAVITDIPNNKNIKSVAISSAKAKVEGSASKITISPYMVKLTATTEASTELGIENGYQITNEPLVESFTSTISDGITAKSFGGNFSSTSDLVYEQTNILSGATIGSLEASYTPGYTTALTVQPGESQTVGMTVKSSGNGNYCCPLVSLYNEHGDLIGVTRQDNACWGSALEYTYTPDATPFYLKKAELASNWNWGTFASKLNNETVYITVANNGNGRASIRYYVIYEGGETHYQYYDNIAIDANKNISFKLGFEECSLTFM